MDIKVKDFVFKKASQKAILQNIERLIEIDKSYFFTESWDRNAFIAKMPFKFRDSLLLFYKEELIGYAIVSDKEESCHVHRLVIHNKFVSKGFGKKLLNEMQFNKNQKSISLKVHIENIKAINFYSREGFITQEKIGCYYKMIKECS